MVSYMICYEQIINTVSYHSNLYLQPLNPSIFNLTDRLLGKLELNFTIYYIIHLDFHVCGWMGLRSWTTLIMSWGILSECLKG